LYVSTVFTLSPRRAAISLLLYPRAIFRTTSSSRSLRSGRFGSMAGRTVGFRTLAASAGSMYVPPAATARIAWINSLDAARFRTYPTAPVPSISRRYPLSS